MWFTILYPFGLILMLRPVTLAAQTAPQDTTWDVTRARGQTRTVDFVTDQGTWMSVDLSPDGRWIVFDLLGHVYRMPAAGGEAQNLTQASGVAVNFHPRISPDGRSIAFVSDRKGQNNLWIMDADGSNPRAVFTDNMVRVVEPAWTPDGQYIVVRRQKLALPGQSGSSGIWMYHRDGGQGVELLGSNAPGASWPSVSSDGRYVYYHGSAGDVFPSGHTDALKGSRQVRRFDFRTGAITEVTSGTAQQQFRGSSGGGYAPEVSPDGRWLTFARRIPDGTISYKGHQFGPRTALWLRDLESGAERLLMDPIEVDMAEGIKVLRILPGYSWSRDGRSLVISQGGKIRRLDVRSGAVTTIPFTARVERTVSEMTRAGFRISDGPFEVKFTRWPVASPDGRTLLVQAVGKIWVMDQPNGTPRRLTPESFTPFEFSPAWSPDGRWIVFTTWDDAERGHVYRMRRGETPERLTQVSGEYIHPIVTPDGNEVVVARGAGETARGRGWSSNPWYDLVRLPATGGAATVVTRVSNPVEAGFFASFRRQIVRPAFGPENRLFFPELQSIRRGESRRTVTALVSVKLDGTDRKEHFTFPFADEIVPSPDGRWVAFQEGDNVYLTPFPWMGTGEDALDIEKRRPAIPATQLTRQGGLFPRWRDAATLEYGSGNRFYVYRTDTRTADTVTVRLSVPRAIPRGSIALTGARIVTMDDRRVVDRGTIVVRAGRIACVGECNTAGVDRTIDISGATIIPGLVDMHAHHYREHRGIIPARSYETAVYLAYGVTTNLDNSMWSQEIFATAELIEAGLSIGPRTYSTGDPLYSGDESRRNELTSYAVAEDNIARLQSWGAVAIKQYLQPRREQRQWVSDIARKRGLMVTSEGSDLEYNVGMILDGQTGFEHPMSYTVLYGDATRFFGRTGATYSPTFIVGGAGPWNEEYFYQESEVWKDPKQRRFLPWRLLVPHTRRRMLRPVTDYSFPLIAQALGDIVAEGGTGAIGSHGQHHGLGSHWEVWMAASATGPMAALEVATLHGARFLGAEQDIGSITVGKLGDLVVLNSNPLDEIRNTLDMRYVMKAGRLYDAATLDEVWPEANPFGPYYWVDEDALRSDDRPVDYWDRPRGR